MEEIELTGSDRFSVTGRLKSYTCEVEVPIRCISEGTAYSLAPSPEGQGVDVEDQEIKNMTILGEGPRHVSADALKRLWRESHPKAIAYLQELIAAGEVVIVANQVVEFKNYYTDLEPSQPSIHDFADDRSKSKCKRHRREARGWR